MLLLLSFHRLITQIKNRTLFALNLSSSGCDHTCPFALYQQRVWLVTHLTPFPYIPALFITSSLIQAAGHKMAAVTVVFFATVENCSLPFFLFFFFIPIHFIPFLSVGRVLLVCFRSPLGAETVVTCTINDALVIRALLPKGKKCSPDI